MYVQVPDRVHGPACTTDASVAWNCNPYRCAPSCHVSLKGGSDYKVVICVYPWNRRLRGWQARFELLGSWYRRFFDLEMKESADEISGILSWLDLGQHVQIQEGWEEIGIERVTFADRAGQEFCLKLGVFFLWPYSSHRRSRKRQSAMRSATNVVGIHRHLSHPSEQDGQGQRS